MTQKNRQPGGMQDLLKGALLAMHQPQGAQEAATPPAGAEQDLLSCQITMGQSVSNGDGEQALWWPCPWFTWSLLLSPRPAKAFP